mmetsp:Transcript_11681/g.25595  ORF Transcript_11681/g.25595 Transcript_11681/m.25595 type:complete len:150 (+) Transcript_11681:255-704(+)
MQAANANGNVNADNRANSVVMEFLAIIKESRSSASIPTTKHSQQQQQQQPPQTTSPHPFHLMKKVWTLILSIASQCSGTNANSLANDLAQKFDAFLPEGYSMVSSNLLLLEGSLLQNGNQQQQGQDGGGGKEGCARTEEEYIEVVSFDT